MSKIFEALQKTSGDVAEFTLPMVTSTPEAAPSPNGASTLVEDIVRDTAPTAADIAAVIAIPYTAEAEADAMPAELAEPDMPMNGQRTRVVSLRLSAESPILPFDADHAGVHGTAAFQSLPRGPSPKLRACLFLPRWRLPAVP